MPAPLAELSEPQLAIPSPLPETLCPCFSSRARFLLEFERTNCMQGTFHPPTQRMGSWRPLRYHRSRRHSFKAPLFYCSHLTLQGGILCGPMQPRLHARTGPRQRRAIGITGYDLCLPETRGGIVMQSLILSKASHSTIPTDPFRVRYATCPLPEGSQTMTRWLPSHLYARVPRQFRGKCLDRRFAHVMRCYSTACIAIEHKPRACQ